jgi:hypothetical protein
MLQRFIVLCPCSLCIEGEVIQYRRMYWPFAYLSPNVLWRKCKPRWSCIFFYISAQQPPMGQGLLIHEVSRSHTTTHHSRWDSSGRVISLSQRMVMCTFGYLHLFACPNYKTVSSLFALITCFILISHFKASFSRQVAMFCLNETLATVTIHEQKSYTYC